MRRQVAGGQLLVNVFLLLLAGLLCSSRVQGLEPELKLQEGVLGSRELPLQGEAEFYLQPAFLGCLAGISAAAVAVVAGCWSTLKLHVKPVLALCGFMVVGPALITLNKNIMEEYDFPFPLTLSGLGLLTSSIFAQVLVRSGFAQLRPKTVDAVSGCNYWRIVFPLAMARAVALACGNAVYLHLSLGFIQMLKAFTPAIVLVVMYIVAVEPPLRPSICCVAVIVAGTLVEVNGELHASSVGLLLMLASSIGEAIATVMNQKMLQNWSFSEVETMYFIAGPSTLVLTLPAGLLEWSELVRSGRYMVFVERPLQMLAAALLGMGVNFITLLVIGFTSSMTVKVLNQFRCIGLVAVGVVIYGETRSARQLWGYGLSLLGFVGYNYFQFKRDKARAIDQWVDSRLLRCGRWCCRQEPPGSPKPQDAPFLTASALRVRFGAEDGPAGKKAAGLEDGIPSAPATAQPQFLGRAE